MKTNDFIKESKKILQNSTIQPSEQAWEKMNAMLDQTAKKKKRKKLIFWTYAAAFVGLLFGLTILFKTDKKIIDDSINTIVIQAADTINANGIKQKLLEEKQVEEGLLASQKEEVMKEGISNSTKISKRKEKQITIKNTQQDYAKTKKVIVITTQIKTVNKLDNEETVLANTTIKSEKKVTEKQNAKNKKPIFNTSDDAISALLADALTKENTSKKYQLHVAENTLQKTAATKGDMTVNKFLKNMIKAGVDTAENIITANDN